MEHLEHPIYAILIDAAETLIEEIMLHDPEGESEAFSMVTQEILPMIGLGYEPHVIFERVWEATIVSEMTRFATTLGVG
jgi:hypothetical protein